MPKNKIYSTVHSLVFTFILMAISTFIAFICFELVANNYANISLIYILALVMVARFTEGYWYGIVFSLFSVICINFFFTFPFFKLNFTLTGYPLTFLIMLIITIITSAATSHIKIQAKQLSEQEAILNKAEKEQMRANLLRAISHDLRTPLTSIIGASNSYFELSEDANITPNPVQTTSIQDKKDALVHQINDDAEWLLNMVENLLSVTRIQNSTSTKVNTSLEVVEEIVSEAVMRFKKRQPDASLTVSVPDEFIMIPMDSLLIEQVIINLLENASVHSQSEHPIIFTVKDNPQYVSFHVRDYGIGISPDLIPTIFDGTSTRSARMSDAHKGMGIGLSICKTIVSAHSGTIQAINYPDGAEFMFTLPKEEANE